MTYLRTVLVGVLTSCLVACDSSTGRGYPASSASGTTPSAVTSGSTGATGSSSPGPAGPQVGAVPPVASFPSPGLGKLGVVAIAPADYARNVSVRATLSLTFSEPVAQSAVDQAVTLSRGEGALAGTWSAGPDLRVHTFTPSQPLDPAAHYLVRIESLTGNLNHSLDAPFRAGFATEDRPRSPLLAAAYAYDVTPPVGSPLGGYGSDKRRNALFDFLPGADHDPTNYRVLFKPSTGIRDAIRVKVLVLDDGVRKVGIISIDAIGCSSHLFEDVAPKVQAATGIRPGDLFIHGTHTHHGPAAIAKDRLYWHIAMDHFDQRVYDPIAGAILAGLTRAVQTLRPAELGVTTVQEDRIGRNRRGNPGRYGKNLNVIKVVEPGGAAIATLFNLPVHPSALAIDDLRFSADLAGEAERLIESTVGGVGMFVNGCEGDVKAHTPGGRSEAHMVALGQMLGARVVQELPHITTQRDVPLDTASMVVDMGPPFLKLDCTGNVSFVTQDICNFFQGMGYAPNANVPLGNLHSRVFRFSALRLGKLATITTIPGEGITALGNSIRGGLGAINAPHPIVFGLTNGHMAYITDAAEYDQGGYESASTLFGRDTGARVVGNALFLSTHLAR